jgi:hypothetical protein
MIELHAFQKESKKGIATSAVRQRVNETSVDRLLNILNRLGHSVEVRISAEEHDPDEAQTLVTVS